jgi:hypothetical protein
MSRQIRLYPFGDLNLPLATDYDPNEKNQTKPWINIEINTESATELWIDSNHIESGSVDVIPVDLSHKSFQNIEKVYFYDFFHTRCSLGEQTKENIQQVSRYYPTTWYTCNALPVEGITCVRFDYLWNWTRAAFLDNNTTWKRFGDPKAHQQHLLHFNRRSERYLSLNRGTNPYRQKLLEFLKSYDGFASDVGRGLILPNDIASEDDIQVGFIVPPAAHFFNNSYISCQVESQYDGIDSIIFTEKTYDHLIQGRLVLNFGPVGFYKALEADGWKLPIGIDLSWDSIQDTEHRFCCYINTLKNLFEMPMEQLHELFLLNYDTIKYNYNRLIDKPYDYID